MKFFTRRPLHTLLLVVVLLCIVVAFAVPCADAQVPHEAAQWRNRLTREARQVWGPEAPVATFAAQMHQESGWSPDAISLVGAQGMAQFMPATSAWIAGLYPELAENQPRNPVWAIRALVTYDRFLWERTNASRDCDHMAKTLSAYNGGLTWVQRDERQATAASLDAALWFDSVETMNAGRAPAMWTENRGYPRRILRTLEPRYINAGWLGGSCVRTD